MNDAMEISENVADWCTKRIYQDGYNKGCEDTIYKLRELIIAALDQKTLMIFDKCVERLESEQNE